jgi:hypothetical protein
MDTSSDIRQRWLDEERSVRRRMAEVGVISPDQLHHEYSLVPAGA